MRNSQTKLFKLPRDESEHGGGLKTGKRKQARPFQRKKLIHLVLRSKKAQGEFNLLRSKHEAKIGQIIRKQGQKNYVEIREFVNVGNHLHLKIKAYSRESFQSFLRTITALIAREVTGAKKGRRAFMSDQSISPLRKFWDSLAYSRILHTSKEDFVLRRYFTANFYEASFGRMARDIYLAENPFGKLCNNTV